MLFAVPAGLFVSQKTSERNGCGEGLPMVAVTRGSQSVWESPIRNNRVDRKSRHSQPV